VLSTTGISVAGQQRWSRMRGRRHCLHLRHPVDCTAPIEQTEREQSPLDPLPENATLQMLGCALLYQESVELSPPYFALTAVTEALMRRTSLLLFVIAPLLLLLLLTQLADSQAARTLQADSTPAALPTGAVTTPDSEQTEPAPAATPTEAAAQEAAVDVDAPAAANVDALEQDEAEENAPAADGSTPISPALSVRVRAQIPLTMVLPVAGLPLTSTADDDDAVTVPAGADAEAGTAPAPTPASATRPTLGAGASPSASAAVTAALGSDEVSAGALITGAELVTDVLIPLTASVPSTESGLIEDLPALTLTIGATDGVTETDDAAPVASTPLEIPDDSVSDTADATAGGASEEAPLLTLTADDAAATADPEVALSAEVTASYPMTLDMDITVLVTDTMTSTAPATLVLKLAGMPTLTVPISVVFGTLDEALIYVEPVTLTEALTSSAELTDSEELTLSEVITLSPSLTLTEESTVTEEATATAEAEETPAPLTPITVTVPVTTNVRPGPGINFDPVRTVSPNSVLEVIAIDNSREWLLLTEGNWIAVVVLGEAPTGLPVANAALVEQVRAEAALRTPTPTPTPTAAPPTPTPLPPTGPVTGTTTTNANLRGGPGTTFDIVGNTVLGQVVTVVARNEAGDWLRLDTGQWISASLVAGLPAVATIPVFDPNATPTPALVPTATPPGGTAVTTTVPATGTQDVPLLPTATPTPGGAAAGGTTAPPAATPAPTPAGTPVPLNADENLYLVEFDTITRKYSLALTGIDRLVDSASGSPEVLTDPQWNTDMTTAVQLLRSAGADVERVAVPERFAPAHGSLGRAATQYNAAADALALGIAQASVDPFAAAFSAITLGDAALAEATSAVAAFRP
jgi:uncharacterized protein YgiM (DUF1202 family)